jgi:hypothetical protein
MVASILGDSNISVSKVVRRGVIVVGGEVARRGVIVGY